MNLHCEVSGSGPAIALLHGFTTSGRAWADMAARLANRFRMIAVDLPGHGRSPAPPGGYDFAACLDDVLAASQRAAGGDRLAALLGYSMGGRIALGAALRNPGGIDRLILESASPGLPDERERADRRAADATLARRIESGDWPAFIDEWLAQPIFASLQGIEAEALAHSRAVRRANDPAAIAAALRCLGSGAQPSYWHRLGEARMPVLLITGAKDAKFDSIAARMQGLMPDSRRCVVAAAGHTTHLEAPAAFAATVLDFVSPSAGKQLDHAAAT